MSSPDQTIRNRFLPTKKTEAASRHAGRKRKRPLTLAVYDPAAAEELAAAASLLSFSDRAGALVPFLARPPVDAVPLSFAAPRAEPPWLRQRLGLRLDLTVHFVGEKAVTVTDLDGQQNRFRLPTEPVLRVLRSILFDEELDAAKIPRAGMEVAPVAPKKPPPTKEELLQGKGNIVKRTNRKQGAKHGGLPVSLCNVDAGVMDLRLTRWESTHAVVVKGEGYLDFITRCGFKENDVVEIWAFKERQFHYFGQWFLRERPLCVVLAKKQHQPAPLLGMGKCTIL
uniref:Uncharacterized protein n=1 Tax=Avena sativa TaxID=4498 RepID=A0ACD5VTI6_AVESA